MFTEGSHSVSQNPDRIAAARDGSLSEMGVLLESARRYLALFAEEACDKGLRGKLPPSDLVQQSLLEAHRDFQSFRGHTQQQFHAWLRRILLHNLANARRRFAAAKRDVGREIPIDEIPGPATSDRTPSSLIAHRELSDCVGQAIGRLSADHQQVVRLRSMQRLSFEETGRRMGRSADAARKLWFRAVQQLRDQFDEVTDAGTR